MAAFALTYGGRDQRQYDKSDISPKSIYLLFPRQPSYLIVSAQFDAAYRHGTV